MIVAAAYLRFQNTVVRRLTLIERRLASFTDYLGVPRQEVDTADIIEQLTQGSNAEAVKLYRQRTGVGLLEAKQAVDDLARRRNGEEPE